MCTTARRFSAWRDWCELDGLARNRFNEIRQSLERRGVIRIDGDRVTGLTRTSRKQRDGRQGAEGSPIPSHRSRGAFTGKTKIGVRTLRRRVFQSGNALAKAAKNASSLISKRLV